jgi:hypothetical protein
MRCERRARYAGAASPSAPATRLKARRPIPKASTTSTVAAAPSSQARGASAGRWRGHQRDDERHLPEPACDDRAVDASPPRRTVHDRHHPPAVRDPRQRVSDQRRETAPSRHATASGRRP